MGLSVLASRKEWDSEFFGREIHALAPTTRMPADELDELLAALDTSGVWGVEALVPASCMTVAPTLEAAGFRLVDSRMQFEWTMSTADIPEMTVPYGRLRPACAEDLPRVSALTTRHLVDDPAVISRFKDPRLFSREESVAYYEAWNALALRSDPDLFVVWDVDDEVVAYYNAIRTKASVGDRPVFRSVLTVIEPAHRRVGAQIAMQAEVFPRFGVPGWRLDTVTQVSNAPVIRNAVAVGKTFVGASLIFYRTSPPADVGLRSGSARS